MKEAIYERAELLMVEPKEMLHNIRQYKNGLIDLDDNRRRYAEILETNIKRLAEINEEFGAL